MNAARAGDQRVSVGRQIESKHLIAVSGEALGDGSPLGVPNEHLPVRTRACPDPDHRNLHVAHDRVGDLGGDRLEDDREAARLLQGDRVVEYPRITAQFLGEEMARDPEGTQEKYDGEWYIIEGEVASEDRYGFALDSVEGHPVTCNHGLMSGPAFDSIQKGDQVEILAKVSIYQGKATFDIAVNYGYSY